MDPVFDLWRRDEENEFESTCTITRPDGSTWDGEQYVASASEVYSGACRIQSTDADAIKVQAGERQHMLKRVDVFVPWTVAAEVGDTVTVDDSPDPIADGVEFRVLEVPKGDWTTTRPLLVEESV